MGLLSTPESWIDVPLDLLLEHVIGGDWGKNPEHDEQDYQLVACIRGSEFKRWASENGRTAVDRRVKGSSLEKRALRPGDILLEISGGGPEQPVGRTVLIDESVLSQFETPVVGTNFLRLLRPFQELDQVFLSRYLEFFYKSGEVVRYQGGSNNLRNLKFKEYSKIDIPVPPLAEQKAIAEKLDTLLAQVESTKARLERIPKILKRFRQSVLAAAVSGKLTEEWRKFSGAREGECIRLDEVVESSFYGPRFSKSDYTNYEDGIPTVRTTDMRGGAINISSETPRVKVPSEKLEQFQLQKGDLLITRTGSIGVMAIFDGGRIAIPSAYLIRFRLKKTVDERFIYFSLTSPEGQRQMGLGATAITQPNINAKSIRSLTLMLPSLEEQTEIVRRVDQLFAYADTIETQVNNALDRVNNLTQSILAKAFRGELTEQWRKDNPDLISGENSASALLEKIKAERAAAKPVKRGRRKA